MSTTIKRIALVAVAALGLSVMSVAPSTAAINQDSLTLSAATAAQTTAETATATSAVATLSFLGATGDSVSVTAALVSGPAGNTALPFLRLAETSSAKINGADAALNSITNPNTAVTVNAVLGSAVTTAKFRVFLGIDALTAPTVAGTYVVRLTPASVGASGALLGATAQTLTITVTAAPALDTVVSTATSIINAGETASATADVVVTGSMNASTTVAAATIKITTSNAAAVAISSESLTATISGPGLLGSGANTANNAGVIDGPSAVGRAITMQNGHVLQVFPDGTSGVSTVTISSAAGKILATETLTFFGAAARIVTTVSKAVIGGSTSVADVLSVVVTDAAGTRVSNLSTVNIVSSDVTKIAGAYTSAVATYSTTTGAYLVPLTPVAAGTANIIVTTKASATATTGVDAAAVSVRVGSSTPASVTVTTDKTSYAPGEKATLSVKLFDATGLALADGADYVNIFAVGGIVGNYTINGDTTTATSVLGFAAGTKDYTIFMPVTEGTITFAWTTGTGLATANQAVKGSVSVEVSSASTSAAIDAANEAASAAQDATDAAIQAADAADEATAAVAALTLEVNTLIAGLKKQLTTLTNLVIRIQKKVRA